MQQDRRWPAGETHRRVAEVLGTDDFAEHDDLFDHGHDSLGMIRLFGAWREDVLDIMFENLAAGHPPCRGGRPC